MRLKDRSFYAAVFFAAGAPALLYQVVWQRVITLYFGVDVYSAAVTVSAFMMGLGVGALLGGLLADRLRLPERAYALCEILLAACGVFSVPTLKYVGESLAGASLLPMAGAVFLTLLVPTLLMGMTLPLMVRTLANKRGAALGADLAWLYGVNTLGAAVGALLTTYQILGKFGFVDATRLAAALNAVLGLAVAFVGQNSLRAPVAELAGPPPPMPGEVSRRRVIELAFLSGAVALGFEVVWYRLLHILLHGTTYVFGTILGVMLLAMSGGSLWAERTMESPHAARRFGRAQLGVALYTLLVFVLLARASSLPGLRHLLSASFFQSFHPSPALAAGGLTLVSVYSLLDVIFWPSVLLGPPAFFMGYGFPNLLRQGERSFGKVGMSLGAVYAANIVGAILGSLFVGFWALEHLGSEGSLLGLAVGALVAALLSGVQTDLSDKARILFGGGALALALLFPARGDLVRVFHFANFVAVEYEGHEDMAGVVALRKQKSVIAFSEEKAAVGTTRLYIDGARHGDVIDAPELNVDEEVKMALSARRAPRRVLSIGLGNGRMVAAALTSPWVEQVTVVELSRGLRPILANTPAGKIIENSTKLRYINDDGRRYLFAHPEETYDAIFGWPLHAAHAYSGNLFSLEFFELVKSRLAPDGLFFTRTVDYASTAKTLAHVFPYLFRIGGLGFWASASPPEFSAERAGMPLGRLQALLVADRLDILEAAGSAPLAYDFFPRSEYYLTYPWASAMDPRASQPLIRARGPLGGWISP